MDRCVVIPLLKISISAISNSGLGFQNILCMINVGALGLYIKEYANTICIKKLLMKFYQSIIIAITNV